MKMADYFPYYQKNLNLAIPVVISQIGQVTVSLVDNVMVGHVGTTELAAASFANNVFVNGMLFGMGITFGLTPLVGKAYGKGDMNEAYIWLKNGMFTHILTAIVLFTLMLATYFFLPFMGQTPEVTELAKPFYLLLCASYIPFLMFFTMKQFFEGLGNTRVAMRITIMANVINIIFNYLLVFGKFGFPKLGLIGSGIGTFIARTSMPLFFLYYILKNPVFRNYFVMAYHQTLNKKRMVELLQIGLPIGFQVIVEVIAFTLGAIMMGWFGEVPLAAHQVAIGMATFTYMISLGISQANTIRVSHQTGVHDFKEVRNVAYASTQLVLIFMSLMGLLFILFRNLLPYLFTPDQAVITIASGLLIIAAIFQVFDGLQVVMMSSLRGMADVKLPMIFAIFAYMVVGLPMSYLLAFKVNLGPAGIWYGYLIGLGLAGILFYLRFRFNLRENS